MNTNLQDSDFRFFLENHEKLLAEYAGKFLGIKDSKVLFAKDSFEEALEEAQRLNLELGTFLIQECTEGDSAYTQEFHSRVVFAV